MKETPLRELEEKIGYRFHDRKLLTQALSHSSFANEHRAEGFLDNERLEFLGDAVLELVSSDFLYHAYPEMQEGAMTKLRASLVCEPTLALSAKEFDLSSYLMLGRGEEHTGGRWRASIVSDAFEALIGAMYLDGGLAPARTFIERYVMKDIDHKKLFYDSKTVLQEMVQKDPDHGEIRYVIVDEMGPDHAKSFQAEVWVGEKRVGSGRGSTKKQAEQEAAYRAIQAVNEKIASGKNG